MPATAALSRRTRRNVANGADAPPYSNHGAGTRKSMRKTTWIAGALAAALLGPLGGVMVAGAATPPGLHIANGKLVEKNGTPFVFRGVNHAHTWYTSRTAAYKPTRTSPPSVRTVSERSCRAETAGPRTWFPTSRTSSSSRRT